MPVLLVLLWRAWYRRQHPASVWSRPAAGLLFAFGVFVLAYWLGQETGRGHYSLQQRVDFPAMPRVQVWLKTPASPDAPTPPLATELAGGCYRLLVLNRSALFVWRPPPGGLPAQTPVLALPLGEVQALQILPVFTSCPASVSP